MNLTFYNNKLLRHPERLSDYLRGKEIVPLTLDIDLTNRCNCKCPECVGMRQSKTETLKLTNVIPLLYEAKKLGVQSIVFTGGGEPTLHPSFNTILSTAKEDCGLETAVVTNGLLLSDRSDMVMAIVKYCTWVRISVDAGDKEMYKLTHGVDQYDKVILGLKTLADEKKHQNSDITIGAAFLTGEETIDGIDACCRDVEAAGANYFYLRPFLGDTTVVDIDRYRNGHNNGHFEVIGAKAYKHLEDTRKSYSRCGFGWWVSVVMADGTVTWCCRTRCNPRYTLGNIYEENLETILKRRKDIKVYFNDCAVLCRGDEVNKFLDGSRKKVMHEAFL